MFYVSLSDWILFRSYRHRIALKQCNAVQNTRDLRPEIPNTVVIVKHSFVNVVHAGQAFDSATSNQRVHGKIHRLGQVLNLRTELRQAFLTSLRRHLHFTPWQLRNDKDGKRACD